MGLSSACGQQNFENTDVKGFAQLMENPDVLLLDVRTQQEYDEGHLQGAMLIDQGREDFMQVAKDVIPAGKKIAVYCRSGRRSANAAEKLAGQG